MDLIAGKRLQALRLLIDKTREDFADLCELDLRRLENIEYGKARMAEGEYENICRLMPEFCLWLTYGGDVSLKALKESDQKFCRFVAAKFESDLIDSVSPIFDRIK